MTFELDSGRGYSIDLEPARDYSAVEDIASLPEGLELLLDLLKRRNLCAVANERHLSPAVIEQRCGEYFCSLTGMKLDPKWVTDWLLSMPDGMAFVESAYCDASESVYVQGMCGKGRTAGLQATAGY